jgi:hypothetical protein
MRSSRSVEIERVERPVVAHEPEETGCAEHLLEVPRDDGSIAHVAAHGIARGRSIRRGLW